MISPHAQALYDRLIKQGPSKAMSPEAMPGGKDEHEHEGAGGGDLAPEKETAPSREVSFDERTSDEPASLHGLDQGQHDMHPGDQGIDEHVKAGPPRVPGKSDIHATSRDGHNSGSEGVPSGSFGNKRQQNQVGDALSNFHYQSPPGTMGQKVNAKVMSHLSKMKK